MTLSAEDDASSAGGWSNGKLASTSARRISSTSAIVKQFSDCSALDLQEPQQRNIPGTSNTSWVGNDAPTAPGCSSHPANTVFGFKTPSFAQNRDEDSRDEKDGFLSSCTSSSPVVAIPLPRPPPPVPAQEVTPTAAGHRQVVVTSPFSELIKDSWIEDQLLLCHLNSKLSEDVEANGLVRYLREDSFLDARYDAAVVQSGSGRANEMRASLSEEAAVSSHGKLTFVAETSTTRNLESRVYGETRIGGWHERQMSSSQPIPLPLPSCSTSTSTSPDSSFSFGSTMSFIPSPLSPHRSRLLYHYHSFSPSNNITDESGSTNTIPNPNAMSSLSPQATRRSPFSVRPFSLNAPESSHHTPISTARVLGQSSSPSPYSQRKSLERKSPDRPVGSFEECVFAGRLALCGTKVPNVEGFMALLAVCGKGVSPTKKKLPFTANYLPAEREGRGPPYFASIPIDGSEGLKDEGDRGETKAGSRYRVPFHGQIQLVITNPEGTPVHTFCTKYDMRHMKPKAKTFLRQRVLAVPKTSPEETRLTSPGDAGQGRMRYAMHMRFVCLPHKTKTSHIVEERNPHKAHSDPGRLYVYGVIRVIFSHQQPDTASETLHYETTVPHN
mmetsp:Transcript_46241/g.77082  ORF Transcript_46241/g.77082 Transcript_46241/m.77082 type:complete len:612 (+) Transcript_46241:347-2182(+)|eukprot:CAMPEP_0198225026 /NCGR_PEP_ID=MMETSP1445-20131203/99372_1 /TAXON_ID=36898 /ORGANISM="Pyramimonas sp., Strain CCMP2087" /LENGTH=611 /DNA_ID=CAMNT_0043904401 /DNA_START=274 /DNA_END=2109 /DNA_ORIENTATION=+